MQGIWRVSGTGTLQAWSQKPEPAPQEEKGRREARRSQERAMARLGILMRLLTDNRRP